MSERIEVGDLVVIVRPCPHCGDTESLGYIFRVSEIALADGDMECCGNDAAEMSAFEVAYPDAGTQLSILKRIPPLSELESTEHKEEMPA